MATYIIAPAGLSAAGTWMPGLLVSPARPPAVLAEDIDESNGEVRSLFSGVHPVDAEVKEAFRLHKGTGPAVMDAGQSFRSIRRVGPTTARQLLDEAKRVMAPFVLRGDVEIGELVTEVPGDMGAVYLEYTNKRAGAPARRVKIGA